MLHGTVGPSVLFVHDELKYAIYIIIYNTMHTNTIICIYCIELACSHDIITQGTSSARGPPYNLCLSYSKQVPERARMQGACLYVLTVALMFTGWYFSSTGREEGMVPHVNWGEFALQSVVSSFGATWLTNGYIYIATYVATRSIDSHIYYYS